MGFLINTTDVYRVDTVEEVEALHEELTKDSRFTLTSFSYKTKDGKDLSLLKGKFYICIVTPNTTVTAE